MIVNIIGQLRKFPYTPAPTVTPTLTPATPGKLFLHVHMAKTAGTFLNEKFANQFERICGHKGYSADFFQSNLRYANKGNPFLDAVQDDVTKLFSGYTRERVHLQIMEERGFEDCDWVSNEVKWEWWVKTFSKWPEPVQMHLPCRDPVDHLLSMCNFRRHNFDCDGDLIAEIKKCTFALNRFSTQLTNYFEIKCFTYDDQFTLYPAYMETKLQRRRHIGVPYWLKTNKKRNKNKECLLVRKDAREKVHQYLVNHYEYYKFCQSCDRLSV